MFKRSCAIVQELAREKSGVAIVEAALVAPVLALVIMGVVDTAGFAAAKLQVQQGINRGLELAMASGPTLTTENIQTQVAAQAEVATADVIVTRTLECGGTVTDWASTCGSGQEIARYTQVQITTTFEPGFALGLLARLQGNADGDIPIETIGVVRTE